MTLENPSWMAHFRSRARSVFRKHSLPRWVVFTFDLGSVVLTFYFSYLLRFNFEFGAIDINLAVEQSLLVFGVYCIFELIFRSFSGLIRHTTIQDIFNVILSASFSAGTLLALSILSRILGWSNILTVPISIIMIHFVTVSVLLFVVRILVKMIYELVSNDPKNKKNVIIFGAGSMGVIVKRVIGSDNSNEFNIVAFLDNNRKLQNKSLSGIPVFGPKKLKKEFLEKYQIDTMIFAIVNIPSNEKADIYRFAVDLGLEVLEVPEVHKWLNGTFQVNQLKKIRLQDLLSREPIKLNMKMIANGLSGKTILVTGAAGSIGSEIVRQLTRFNMKRMILVDNAETPMFQMENELREHFPLAPVCTILGDVTDQVKMDRLFRKYSPEIVFHAAAYKHVPLMEENPHEAIRVNVGSTAVLTKLSVQYDVQKFVMVSTDKAVNPTNVMGASKRMCEMILRSRSLTPGNRTRFVITRFGNVLGSNGSVIPIFRKQIEEGGPVTVTHRNITRYFMTIREACQLVLEAGFMGMGGEIFVFDMGHPVKIADLAKRMIRLSGYVPDEDIKIEYTGLRPGEKLFEELLANKEKTLPTYNPKVKTAEVAWLDYQKVLAKIHKLLYAYQSMEDVELVRHIMAIVPEYSPHNQKYSGLLEDSDEVEIRDSFPD